MKKNILIVSLSFLSINSFSQETAKKTKFYQIYTKDAVLEDEREVILKNDLFLVAFDDLPIRKEIHRLNYKVDENGKITFIKGHKGFEKGFAKSETPYELIGIQFSEYDDDELITRLNTLTDNIKVIHAITRKDNLTGTILREKQPDCKKLKNIIFYGYIKMSTVLKKL